MNWRTAIDLALALALITIAAAFARPALEAVDEAQVNALFGAALCTLIAGFVIFRAGVSCAPRDVVEGELRLPRGLYLAYVVVVIVLSISVWTWWVPGKIG